MMKMLDCKSVDFHHVFLWFRNTEANFLEYFVFSFNITINLSDESC